MYAIKLNFILDDDFYLTEDTGNCDFELNPMLFETQEKAKNFAKKWIDSLGEERVQIVHKDSIKE
jgi:hypothetical protein